MGRFSYYGENYKPQNRFKIMTTNKIGKMTIDEFARFMAYQIAKMELATIITLLGLMCIASGSIKLFRSLKYDTYFADSSLRLIIFGAILVITGTLAKTFL